MKKIFAVLLVLSMFFVLTACGGKNESAIPNESTGDVTSNTETTTSQTDGSSQDATESTTEGNVTETTEPGSTESKPTEPKPTEPKPAEPKPTEPKPTQPTPTQPTLTQPTPTQPTPTQPTPTQPTPTQPTTGNQSQQAAYERAVADITTEYNRLVAETQQEHNKNLLNLAAAKQEAEYQIGTLRAACLSEVNSLSNQKNALVREKDQALANALANTGGQYNSYYDSLKKQYDDRIAAIDNQIAQTNSKYGKQISEWQTYLNNLPTVADYENLRDLKLNDIEKWKNQQIQNAKNYYGIS